jgi:hypothetical protein
VRQPTVVNVMQSQPLIGRQLLRRCMELQVGRGVLPNLTRHCVSFEVHADLLDFGITVCGYRVWGCIVVDHDCSALFQNDMVVAGFVGLEMQMQFVSVAKLQK